MRQRIRKTILIISFLLFPVTIWYFSPYLIIQAASEHIMNGSFIVFVSMFVLSMFLGRVWCGYLCPAGGLQECISAGNPAPAKQGWRNKIKYVIWIIWMIAIVVTFILGKNEVTVDPFYMTDHGISITSIYNYVMYYGVILLLVLPAGPDTRTQSYVSLYLLDGSVYGSRQFGRKAASYSTASY